MVRGAQSAGGKPNQAPPGGGVGGERESVAGTHPPLGPY